MTSNAGTLFIARVATRSPGLMPSRSSACAMRRASRATFAQLVRMMAIARRADDFARAMLAFGMVDEAHDAQRPVLHCTQVALHPLPSRLIHSVAADNGTGKRFVFARERRDLAKGRPP